MRREPSVGSPLTPRTPKAFQATQAGERARLFELRRTQALNSKAVALTLAQLAFACALALGRERIAALIDAKAVGEYSGYVLVAAALVAFNALTRIVRHLYYRFHVPHEVRLLSPHQLRLLHLDPKLSRVEGKEATSSPSVMSPRVARLPRLATLSNSSDLKWRRPPQMSPDNSLSQSVLYQSERSFTSLNDTSFTLNSSGYVDTSFNTDRSGAFSPLSPLHNDTIQNKEDIDRLLDEEKRRSQERSSIMPRNTTFFGGFDMTSFGALSQLNVTKYLPAVRSALRPEVKSKMDNHALSPPQVWEKIGYTRDEREIGAERCQVWITHAILQPVVASIDEVNHFFQEAHETIRIGIDAPAQLEKAFHKTTMEPKLALLRRILPYLQLGDNQRYLVGRLRKLAEQETYIYCAGGDVVDAQGHVIHYAKDLPKDVEILFHCVCCYFNDPYTLYVTNIPDLFTTSKRSFSYLHVLETPETVKELLKRETLTDIYIYRASDNPPHFQVVLLDKDDKPIIWDIDKGRNNLFLAIVAMLWYVKTERHGRIDTEADQSLSRAGLNVLQILPDAE